MTRTDNDTWDLASSVGATAVRTRYFDDFFPHASRDGVRQAVILASGLDTRAYRLPWLRGTTVYEVDQPAVIEFKTRTLADLPPDAQDRLFDQITALSARGSRLATEHMDMTSLPADWADRLTRRSQRIGSDINLTELFNLGERNSAADYLSGQGWHVDVRRAEQAFAANGFALPDDEVATFGGDSGYVTATLN